MKTEQITLGYGSGGKLSHDLITNLFHKHFSNPELIKQTDSAVLKIEGSHLSFTTDSFVVDPIFFPGGNIGKLAVCGTVNDLAVSGATPLYLSSSFIIEEGFPFSDLEKIVISMAEEARNAGVLIVTGDTKVVNRGKCDKIFINTSGIGIINEKHADIGSGSRIQSGDLVLINGSIANHGMAIMKAREFHHFKADINSDCTCLNQMIKAVADSGCDIKFMRDATRGGLATVISELVENKSFGIEIDESKIRVEEPVRGMCEIIGFDPLYVANEGIVVMVIAQPDAEKAISILKQFPEGKDSECIGHITTDHPGKGWVKTGIGGKRILDMLAGEQLPRIC